MSNHEQSNQFLHGQVGLWDVSTSQYPFPDDYELSSPPTGSATIEKQFTTQLTSSRVLHAFENHIRNGHHQETCDTDIPLQHDTTGTLSLIPLVMNQIAISSSPEFELDSSSLSSHSTTFLDTPPDQSASEPDSNLKITQYNPLKIRKTPALKHGSEKRSKKSRCYGLSARPDALKTDTTPKVMVMRDVKGEVAGTECVFGLSQVVRATASRELQQATSITRRKGACSRCRHCKMRCNMADSLYQPCGGCIKDLSNIPHQLCTRINILDLNVHRKGSTLNNTLGLWVQRKLELQRFTPRDEHVLFLTQDKGAGLDIALSVTVSLFDPGPEDKMNYSWEDSTGKQHTMEMPAYFISDLEAARRSVLEYSYEARSSYIEGLLADSNPIVCQTFQAALTYTTFHQKSLVSDGLRAWVAARFIEGPWRIFCGGAMIGLEPTSEPGNPFNGIIPVTPVMDTQLDDIFLRDLLIPLTKRLLKGLKEKIDEQKRENWLEIYLTMFIMMSNMGWVMREVLLWTGRYGKKPGSRGGTLTRSFIHTCKTMLSYFHFACNGSMPLSIPWSNLDKSDCLNNGMTQDQIAYLSSIQNELSRQESKLAKWKELSMYDDEMYWCYQLLCKDWRGDVPYTGEIDDFRDEDFLKT